MTPLEAKSRKIQVKFSKFSSRFKMSSGRGLEKLTALLSSTPLNDKLEACKAWRGNLSITSLRAELVDLANLFFLPYKIFITVFKKKW